MPFPRLVPPELISFGDNESSKVSTTALSSVKGTKTTPSPFAIITEIAVFSI